MTAKLLHYLDKDLLKEMGITIVGDIIAILKHCKSIDIGRTERDAMKLASAAISSTMSEPDRPKIPPGHELPVPTKRRVSKEIEGTYTIKQPLGTTEKTRRILEQRKLSYPLGSNFIDKSSSSRVVILKAAPSLSSCLPSHQAHVQLDSGSNGSWSGNVYTTKEKNLSVFDRLGSEFKTQQPTVILFHSARSESKSMLSRVIGRTSASQAAVTNRRLSSGDKGERDDLKRTGNDSVFSRLGGGADDLPSKNTSEYRGVFKQPRLIVSLLPNNVISHHSSRISVKNRLGLQRGYVSGGNRPRPAGVLFGHASTNLKTVHDRIGWPSNERLKRS